MTDEQVGKYIRLLCLQHQTGHLREKDMLNICKTYDVDIFSKFNRDDSGLYFNERLDNEINRRQKYSESRRNNRMSEKTYDPHMETATETETITEELSNKRRAKKFSPPTLETVKQFFADNGYTLEIAQRAYDFYSVANWINSKGKPVINWKQTMIQVWFKDEHKVKNHKPVMP